MDRLFTIFTISRRAVVREGVRSILSGNPDVRIVGQAQDLYGALVDLSQTRPDVVVCDDPNTALTVSSLDYHPQVIVFSDDDDLDWSLRQSASITRLSTRAPVATLLETVRVLRR